MASIGEKPAFPETESGMTYREWLIGQALAGICGNSAMVMTVVGARQHASTAIELADAMIAKLDKELCKQTEKWPPLDPGTRVRTTKCRTEQKEWMPEAWVARKWGVTGTIIRHHDSHGLCYDVRHDDGTEGCYDPPEFEVIPG